MNTKGKLKKIWNFIWNDDSLLSWIINIILAFVLVKFLIYPGLGLFLGTTHPVVAVVSGSMEHEVKGFDFWWYNNKDYYIDYDIKKENFTEYRFRDGFNRGDLMVIVRAKEIKKGDVIVFRGDAEEPIIHRVINVSSEAYQTKGDNGITNRKSRTDETEITNDRVVGKAIFRVPYLGWAKLAFLMLIHNVFS